MRLFKLFIILCCIFLNSFIASAREDKEVSVIHFWISGSESKALRVLMKEIRKRGYRWNDLAVRRNNSEAIFNSMISAGKDVSAILWSKGLNLEHMSSTNQIRNLDAIAKLDNWDDNLYDIVKDLSKVKGHYYSVPATIHGSNWIFYSKKVLSKSGVKMPRDWAEFLQVAEKIKQAGYIPLALGGDSWQKRILFMSVALGVGGKKWFDETFLKGNIDKFNSITGRRILKIFRKLNDYVDPNVAERSWNITTNLVVQNKAAFQIMGDWAKGEFDAARKEVNKDYGCHMAPGHEIFMGQIDKFILPQGSAVKAQDTFVKTLTSADVQAKFSLLKGSIPVRKDSIIQEGNYCSKYAFDLLKNSENQTLNPTQIMSAEDISNLEDAIVTYWNNPSITVEQGIQNIVKSLLKE